jgi:hypothetical protein
MMKFLILILCLMPVTTWAQSTSSLSTTPSTRSNSGAESSTSLSGTTSTTTARTASTPGRGAYPVASTLLTVGISVFVLSYWPSSLPSMQPCNRGVISAVWIEQVPGSSKFIDNHISNDDWKSQHLYYYTCTRHDKFLVHYRPFCNSNFAVFCNSIFVTVFCNSTPIPENFTNI